MKKRSASISSSPAAAGGGGGANDFSRSPSSASPSSSSTANDNHEIHKRAKPNPVGEDNNNGTSSGSPALTSLPVPPQLLASSKTLSSLTSLPSLSSASDLCSSLGRSSSSSGSSNELVDVSLLNALADRKDTSFGSSSSGSLTAGLSNGSSVSDGRERSLSMSMEELRPQGARLKVAVVTQKGVSGHEKPNQDRPIVAQGIHLSGGPITHPVTVLDIHGAALASSLPTTELGPDTVSVFGSLDGHGDSGHEVAAYVQRSLPALLAKESTIRKPALTGMCIKQVVKKLSADLDRFNVLRKQGSSDPTVVKVDTARSGCCAIFGVYLHQVSAPGDRRLIVANIGDSRALICRQNNSFSSSSSSSSQTLHSPSNASSSSSSTSIPPSPSSRQSSQTSSPTSTTNPANNSPSPPPPVVSVTPASPPPSSSSSSSSSSTSSGLSINTNASSSSSTMAPPSPTPPCPNTPTEPVPASEISLELLISAIPLSTDHKPGRPDERARIEKSGGRVGITGPGQPHRVFQAGSLALYPGLAVSRAIGDVWTQQLGVISVPDILEHKIDENDIFAVFGSDGLFEFIPNSQIIGTIYQHLPDLQKGAEKLVEEATKRWLRDSKGRYCDDITCVVTALNVPKQA